MRRHPIVETEQYLAERARIESRWGGTSRIRQALAAVLWSLERSPESYEMVEGTTAQAATTRRVAAEGGFVPRRRIVFWVEDNGDVRLYWIEVDEKPEASGPRGRML